jgi:hypothetical protein
LLLIVSTHTNKDDQKCSKSTFSDGFFNKFLESLVRLAEKQEERASSDQVIEHEKNSFPQART